MNKCIYCGQFEAMAYPCKNTGGHRWEQSQPISYSDYTKAIEPSANLKDLDHPCKGTCSGWKQGFEKGAAESARLRERIGALREVLRVTEGAAGARPIERWRLIEMARFALVADDKKAPKPEGGKE